VDVYGYCLDDPVNLVDPLGLKSRIEYYKDGATHVGHIAVAPGTEAAYGKYPAQGAQGYFNVAGEYREEKRPPKDILEIETTPEQEANMQEWLRMAKEAENLKYDVRNKNCVRADDDVLEAGGVKTPPAVDYTFPGAYFDELKKLNQ
jgi:hypothetical protein